MYGIGERFGTLVLALAIAFVAVRLHKSSKYPKVTKPAGIVLMFLAGCGLLLTFVGNWITGLPWQLTVAGLVITAGIVIVDWLCDGRPDKPALWAALFLAAFVVAGGASVGKATGKIGDGFDKVTTQINTPAPNGGR